MDWRVPVAEYMIEDMPMADNNKRTKMSDNYNEKMAVLFQSVEIYQGNKLLSLK